MKYTARPTTRFQKDLKRIQKRGYDIDIDFSLIFVDFCHKIY